MSETYFWDFDGTLYNTYPVMVAAFVHAMQEQHIKVKKDEVYHHMRQTSLGRTFKWALTNHPELDEPTARAAYKEYEEQRHDEMHPFPGVAEVCTQVVDHGGRNFLLTHRDEQAVAILERDGLKKLFSGFVTSKLSFPRKPDPASLNYLCNEYAVDKEHATMIGDRALDVEAGHNAGMKGILFDPDNIINEDGNPDKRIKSMWELVDKKA